MSTGFVSLFAGIGGFDLAFERAGMKGLCHVELDKHCRRLLTPRECERLQGFPDDWTEGADSPRYRELGNAVAVVCAEWLGHRIVKALAR